MWPNFNTQIAIFSFLHNQVKPISPYQTPPNNPMGLQFTSCLTSTSFHFKFNPKKKRSKQKNQLNETIVDKSIQNHTLSPKSEECEDSVSSFFFSSDPLVDAMAGITSTFPFKLIHRQTSITSPYLLPPLSSFDSRLFGFRLSNPNSLKLDSPVSISFTPGSSVTARYGGGGDSRRWRSDSDDDQALDMSTLRYPFANSYASLQMFVEFDG